MALQSCTMIILLCVTSAAIGEAAGMYCNWFQVQGPADHSKNSDRYIADEIRNDTEDSLRMIRRMHDHPVCSDRIRDSLVAVILDRRRDRVCRYEAIRSLGPVAGPDSTLVPVVLKGVANHGGLPARFSRAAWETMSILCGDETYNVIGKAIASDDEHDARLGAIRISYHILTMNEMKRWDVGLPQNKAQSVSGHAAWDRALVQVVRTTSESVALRSAAAEVLEYHKLDQQDVASVQAGLQALTVESDEHIRRSGWVGLQACGQSAVPYALSKMGDSSAGDLDLICRLLNRLKASECVIEDKLLLRLKDESAEVRLVCVRRLGQIRSPRAKESLVQVLQNDPAESVRPAAAVALQYFD